MPLRDYVFGRSRPKSQCISLGKCLHVLAQGDKVASTTKILMDRDAWYAREFRGHWRDGRLNRRTRTKYKSFNKKPK